MTYSLLFAADMGPANTGLTLRAQLYDSDGTPNGAEITSTFVEVDSTDAPGFYTHTATIPDDHQGSFAIYNNADKTQRVGFSVNPVEVEYSDAKTSTRATQADILSDATPFDGADIAAILADTGTDGVVVATATQQAIADEILKRGMSNVEDSADATSLAALVLAAFESVISGTTWTIYKTDHATTFTTRTVTTASAAPIVEVT